MISLGEALVNERKQKNVSLEEISQQTNIGVKSLQALENNRFNLLPGEFYLKNYIKSYLKAIGCDEKTFRETHGEAINDALSGAPPEKTGTYYSRLRYTRFKKKNVLFILFLLAVVVILIFVFLFIYKGKIPGGRRIHNAKVKPVDLSVSNPDLFPLLTAESELGAFSLDYWPVQVDIEFLDNCWLQVHRGSQKILEKVFKKGEKIKLKGYELHFAIGNPSAVKFYLNNHEVTYLKNLSRSERLSLHPSNIGSILEK
jgi:cytoskeletal protein RodZ